MKLYTYREYLTKANSKGQEHNTITNGPKHLHVWTAQTFIENIFRFEYATCNILMIVVYTSHIEYV